MAQFVTTAKKAVELDANERRALTKELETKIVEARGAGDVEKSAAIEKELADLEYVTFPDGSRLHLDNDAMVNADGQSVSVRDFLREMDKDQQALQSVMTCSRPS